MYPIHKDGKVRDPIGLADGANIIGGNEKSTVKLQGDRWVENKHASITISENEAFISDLNTRFGTYVRIRVEKSLKNNDEIRIGRALFRIELPWTKVMSGPDKTIWLGTNQEEEDIFGRLLRIGANDTILQAFFLHKKSVVIGRKQGDILMPNDHVVSGKHAEIIPQDAETCLIRDLGSMNGSYYRIHDSYPLNDGDYFLVGGHLMLLRKLDGKN